MGDTTKRFSSLLTVICRTAKRSANKVAKIRKKKNSGDEISKLATKSEAVGSPCKARGPSNKSPTTADEKGNSKIQAYKIGHFRILLNVFVYGLDTKTYRC